MRREVTEGLEEQTDTIWLQFSKVLWAAALRTERSKVGSRKQRRGILQYSDEGWWGLGATCTYFKVEPVGFLNKDFLVVKLTVEE